MRLVEKTTFTATYKDGTTKTETCIEPIAPLSKRKMYERLYATENDLEKVTLEKSSIDLNDENLKYVDVTDSYFAEDGLVDYIRSRLLA